MRSCLILGSGRGGTSLLAGMIARAGWFAGDALYEPRETNPKGFYEDAEINAINEELLAPVLPPGEYGQGWLAALLPAETVPPASDQLAERIVAQTARRPFCFKDPRFCYTLDAWRPYVGDAAFLCVFRPPLVTARSIAREIELGDYLWNLHGRFGEREALAVWIAMFSHVLERHRHTGDWLFVHYDQLFEATHVSRLEEFLGAPVDRQFADRGLSRTVAPASVSGRAAAIYDQLCDLAGFA